MTGGIVGPRGQPTTAILLNHHVALPFKSHVYIHGLVLCLAFIREASSCSSQWQMHKPITDKNVRNK